MKTLSLATIAFLALTAVACSPAASDDDTASAVGEANAAAKITLANWETHPKIVAVRDIVNAIDASKYASDSRELCQDSGHGEMERTKLTDENGKIRELVVSLGSEDSAEIESHYYDAEGTLRFVFINDNDVHGNASETRIYFDANGTKIWEVYRHAFNEDLRPNLENAPFELQTSPTEIEPQAKDPAKLYNAPPRCD